MLLVLVAGAVIGGVMLLSSSSRKTFTGVAASTADDSDLSRPLHRNAPRTAAAASDATPSDGLPTAAVVLLVFLLGILGVTYLTMVRRARRGMPAIEPDVKLPEIAEADLFERRQWIWKFLADDTRNLLENGMTVRRIMTTDLITLAPSAPIGEVKSAMMSHRCRHVPVCRDDKLVGIISDRDLRSRSGARAADVMTHKPITVSPETQVFQAITILIQKSISCLPVADDGRLLGMVTTTDLLMALQCSLRLLQQAADGHKSAGANRGRRISDLIAAEREMVAAQASQAALEAAAPEAAN
jgi:signal-transduction protein with cAMP-binding, CBS, and nucleotidyltransferase domain